MNNEEKRFYDVEAYLMGKLSPKEKAEFDASIAADPGLAEEVELQRAGYKVVEFLVKENLVTKVKKWQKELEEDPLSEAPINKVKRLPLWAKLSIAAVMLLVVIYFLFIKPNEGENIYKTDTPIEKGGKPLEPTQIIPQQPQASNPQIEAPKKKSASPEYLALTNQFLKEGPVFDVRYLRKSTETKLQAAIIELLNQKKYPQAIDSLRKVKADDRYYPNAQYNIGCAYYAMGKFQIGIPFLKKAANNTDFLYAKNARWYLTLSLLASESVKDAKEHLKIIIDSDGDFSGEGYKLEQALKNIE